MSHEDHPLLSPKNFWLASIYLTVIGLLSARLDEWLKDAHLEPWLSTLVIALICAGGGFLLSTHFQRIWRKWWSERQEVITVVENDTVRAAQGMVAFVSKG